MEIQITNPHRSRKWGFGWSTTPTGRGTSILAPTAPYYSGTIKQVLQARADDPAYRAYGAPDTTNYKATAWFYDNHRVTHVRAYGLIRRADDLPDDETGNAIAYRRWEMANQIHHDNNDQYGMVWSQYITQDLIDPIWLDGSSVTIRTVD